MFTPGSMLGLYDATIPAYYGASPRWVGSLGEMPLVWAYTIYGLGEHLRIHRSYNTQHKHLVHYSIPSQITVAPL